MSNLNRHPVRRAAAGVLAGTLAFTGAAVAAGASPAIAVPGFALERLEGADRYGTAAAIAREAFTTATNVVLASGAPRNFPDALTGNYLAGEVQGPILLTTPGSLPRATRDALTALQTRTVYIVGGTAAVSASVEAELQAMGITVVRLGGIDRYATAEIVAKRVGGDAANIGTIEGGRTAILGNGQNFPDILAAGPLSYSEQFPLAITRPTSLPADTRDVLRDLGITRVIIVGGESAVSAEVEAEVRAMSGITSVTRLSGAQRYDTAVAIANFAYDSLNYDMTHVGLARSDDFADALAAGPLAGKEKAPIVITLPNTLVEPTRAFLEARSNTLMTGHVFGGQAAISTAVENAAEAAAAGTDGASVTTTSTTVEAGQNITGSIAGENIQSVTVSGACIDGTVTLTDTDANAADMQFSVATLNNATSGTCTLTFTTTFVGGATETDTVDVTVTQPVSATVRPELVSASIVGTTTTTQATPTNPAGTTVRYTFDEAIIGGTAAPRVEAFNLYNNDGTPVATTNTTFLSVDGRSVMVRFNAITTTEAAAVLTLATVDVNAVTDQQGFINPEGDAAIGTSGGGDTTLAAGITDAPDLVSVGGFRQAAGVGQTAVDFTFDEAAFVTGGGAFRLVFAENVGVGSNEITCTGPTDTTAGGGTVAGGSGTTTITVICTNPIDPNTNQPSTTPIAATQVARGTVDAGTVSDAATAGNANVLQAADVSNNGDTFEPDLVSVQFQPGATSADVDRAVFTFDAGVDTTTPANFAVYSDEGTVFVGATATPNPQNRQQVLVTFVGPVVNTAPTESTTAVDRAVGGSVTDSAVTTAATATTVALANEQDEAGVANTLAGTVQTPGRTQGPDLTAVSVAQSAATTDQFGNTTPGTFQATYTFDEDVALPANGAEFSLYQADGTRLVGTTVSGTARTEDNDNTVTITGFVVDANNDGVAAAGETTATSAEIGNAVLGTVDNGAVTEDGGALVNPEGAEFTTGGTGTRTA